VKEILAWSDLPIASFGWIIQKKPLYSTEPKEAIPPRGKNSDAGGSVMVYQYEDKSTGNWDVYLWVGQNRQPLATGPGDQVNPVTDGKKVVWQDNKNGNWDLYSYDLVSGAVLRLTSATSDQINPDLDGDFLVWQDNKNGNWDVLGMDLLTGKEIEIYTGPGDQTDPRVGNSKVVWVSDQRATRTSTSVRHIADNSG